MMTVERLREAVAIHGPRCLDYVRRDIQEALTMATGLEQAGMSYDRKRASEYADELCFVAQVRKETQGKACCPACGRINP